MRFFAALADAKSDKLELNIIIGLPQRPVTHALGVKLQENQFSAALRLIGNVKVMGQMNVH